MNMQDASGQLYRRNRYYDPATGRFTQEDPIGLAGGLNLYGFGGGDPVNYSDPFGLAAEKGCPLFCGWEGDPDNVEREVGQYEQMTNRDRAISGGTILVAALGGGAVLRAGAGAAAARLLPSGMAQGDAVILQRLFGQGIPGAHRAPSQGVQLPEGLTRAMLNRYEAVARRALQSSTKANAYTTELQTLRLRIIEEARRLMR